MPRTRTPPPFSSSAYEKNCIHSEIGITENENLLWRAVFGEGKVADKIRDLANRKAYELAGIKIEAEPLKFEITEAVKTELRRHAEAMRKIVHEQAKSGTARDQRLDRRQHKAGVLLR